MPSSIELRNGPNPPPPPPLSTPPPAAIRGRGRRVGQGGAPPPPAGGDNGVVAQAQREALIATTAATVAATNEASRTSTLLAEQTIAFAACNQERIEAQWVVQDAQAAALVALPTVENAAIGETVLPFSAANFARFPKAELQAIFNKTFNPRNLFKLQDNLTYDEKDADDEYAFSTTASGSFVKVRNCNKDFGATSKIWSSSFINYIRIVSTFFCMDHPPIAGAMLEFWSKIMKMTETTRWDAVLALAITFHSKRAGLDFLDHKAWVLTNERMAEYAVGNNRPIAPLPSRHLMSATTPRPQNAAGSSRLEICLKYNMLAGCSWPLCKRQHTCSHKGCIKEHCAEEFHK
jgi:hypothetical protein